MYNTHFGFREKPFKLVPNPDYLFLSKNHEIAMAHLTYAVSQGDGFVVITGEVGTGKTTLCRIFLERMDENVDSAYIFNPKLDSVQLLTTICNEFGIHTNSNNLKQLLDVINGFLISKHQDGRKVILLIDEAQNLSVENLEMVRMLSNLETTRDKLLQIILVGQPELGDKLDSYELRQLAQRISLSTHLLPLGYQEAVGYINHRVSIAAQRQIHLFTPSACRQIHRFSGGTPRLINIACDRALLTAFSLNKNKVTRAVARIAVRELDKRRMQTPRLSFRQTVPWMALVLVVMLFSGLWYFKSGLIDLGLKKDAIESQAAVQGSAASEENSESGRKFKINPLPATDTPTAMQSLDLLPVEARPVPKPAELESALESIAYLESRLHAVASVLKCWDQPPPHQAQLPATFKDAEYFEIAARQYGLRMYTVQSNWSLVKQLNLPAILPLKSAQGGTVYMALVGWRDGQISLAAPDGRGVIHTSLDALLPYVNGPIYLYWKNAIGFDELITAWSPAKQVGAVKNLLRRSGYERVDSEPEFDQETEQAILDFQSRHSLEPDGLIGPLTKILLIQEANIVRYPRLDEQDERGGA